MTTQSLEHLARRLATGFRESVGPESMQNLTMLLRPLLLLLSDGNPVSPEQVGATIGRSRQEAAALLHKLPSAELNEEGHLVGFGLTLRQTPHRFEVEGRTLFTWCALDTLTFPALLGKSARVISPCRATGTEVRVEVTPDDVERVEPAEAVVSLASPESFDDLRSAFCDQTHFFRSPEAASGWLAEHPSGAVLPVAEAFQLGRMLERHLDEPS